MGIFGGAKRPDRLASEVEADKRQRVRSPLPAVLPKNAHGDEPLRKRDAEGVAPEAHPSAPPRLAAHRAGEFAALLPASHAQAQAPSARPRSVSRSRPPSVPRSDKPSRSSPGSVLSSLLREDTGQRRHIQIQSNFAGNATLKKLVPGSALTMFQRAERDTVKNNLKWERARKTGTAAGNLVDGTAFAAIRIPQEQIRERMKQMWVEDAALREKYEVLERAAKQLANVYNQGVADGDHNCPAFTSARRVVRSWILGRCRGVTEAHLRDLEQANFLFLQNNLIFFR